MFSSTILGTGLALLASTQLVAAQSLNLTLTFYPDEDNTCSGDDSKAITFTTASYPTSQSCFNLGEIFARNSTGGFRNSSVVPTPNDEGIRWAITNAQAWDPAGNYSHVKYEQLNSVGMDEDDDATYASRRVNIYNGEDCLQVRYADDDDGDLAPWFGWTCHSSSDDNCRTTPYSIESFIIIPFDEDDREKGKCLTFTEEGAGALSFPGTFGALVSAIVVGFFLL
ncbi:hypothetical protein F5B22DRAFT_39265 [Xylaria bambusicola]|uniref:uncharacterized protein n=1 Tax=Xylaria bambusicola TaxID=326684 RepID=UPI002007265F|nr:uncharacterized protein F5B22DRAFT_39265 [Xylaria bambusicola]KAI0521120.1 hypothetical protein F5B22DRAFT_39265 [Xylaria bambusicola]